MPAIHQGLNASHSGNANEIGMSFRGKGKFFPARGEHVGIAGSRPAEKGSVLVARTPAISVPFNSWWRLQPAGPSGYLSGVKRNLPFSCLSNHLTERNAVMRVKMGTVVPKMGTVVHPDGRQVDYRTAIAMALHDELGLTHRAIKSAMRWTGASERTVKYWLAGERGPSGEHLIALARHSDAVFHVFLMLTGRQATGDEEGGYLQQP